MSRTGNAFRNAGTSLALQLFNNLLRFVCRTVFIYTLGKEFLGISSLYSNVITILNISELGFSTAITFSLYGPLARQDQKQICALMAFYKKAYRMIGLSILALGLMLMPFLPHLMTGVTDKVNIYHYYLLYLGQTVVSYLFFAYKSVLLTADQKKYLSDLVSFICQTAVALAQILVLLLFRSFFVYTLLSIVTHILQNLVTAYLADRRYPYLKNPAPPLSKESRKAVFRQIYALALQKISTAVGTATDNLIIASYVSVAAVGLYDNYHMVVAIFQKFLTGSFRAMTASLGNMMATESKSHGEFVFRSLNRVNAGLVGTCTVCFLTLFQSFIRLWAGEEYLLDYSVLLVIGLNFSTNYQQTVVQVFRNAMGLYVYGKYRSVINAVLNLGISLIFVRWWGIEGVLLGSIVSRLLTTWWYDIWILYRKGFSLPPWRCYAEALLLHGWIFLCWCITTPLSRALAAGWLSLILSAIFCGALCLVSWLLIWGRSDTFQYVKVRITALLRCHRKI